MLFLVRARKREVTTAEREVTGEEEAREGSKDNKRLECDIPAFEDTSDRGGRVSARS